jgi:hypothetical protein
VFAWPGFRHLLSVRLLGQLGDGLFQAGLGGSVLFNPQRAASPFAIVVAFAVLLVPYSTLGPFVGVVLDRWSRRQILVVANGIRALAVLPAAWFVWGADEGVAFVLLALAVIALNRLVLAGLSASMPHVADASRLVTANSIANTAGSIAYPVALGLGAGAFAITGTRYRAYATVAAIAAFAYGAACVVAFMTFRRADLGPGGSLAVSGPGSLPSASRGAGSWREGFTTSLRGFVDALAHLRARPVAARVIIVQALNRGIYGVLLLATLLLYRNYFHPNHPRQAVAGLLSIAVATAAGALLAAVITPTLSRAWGWHRWVVTLLGASGVAVPAVYLPLRQWLLVVGAGVVGIAAQGIKIVSDTAIQVECADQFRGRVFSVNDTAYNIVFVLGLALGSVILPVDGRSTSAVAAVGVAYLLVAVWYAIPLRWQRDLA